MKKFALPAFPALILPLACLLALCPLPAGATIATFDTLGTSYYDRVPNGYSGLLWENFGFLNGKYSNPQEGYYRGTVSTNNIAFNLSGQPAWIHCATNFDLHSAFLTAAFTPEMTVRVQGYGGTVQLYDQTYTINRTNPTHLALNFTGVTLVSFTATPESQFALDDLAVTLPFTPTNPPSTAPTNLTLLEIGTLEPTGLGHQFRAPLFSLEGAHYVEDLLVDQSLNSGGGAVLPAVTADWNGHDQFALTISAPAGKRFLIQVPDGEQARFAGYLWWQTPDGGGFSPRGPVSVVFHDLQGTPPDFSQSDAVLANRQGFFGFADIDSTSFTGELSFTALTFTGTVVPQTSIGGTQLFQAHAASYLKVLYATDAIADPGPFVTLAPAVPAFANLVQATRPAVQLVPRPGGEVVVVFTGTLQTTASLDQPFEDVPGNPQGTYLVPQPGTSHFFRSR